MLLQLALGSGVFPTVFPLEGNRHRRPEPSQWLPTMFLSQMSMQQCPASKDIVAVFTDVVLSVHSLNMISHFAWSCMHISTICFGAKNLWTVLFFDMSGKITLISEIAGATCMIADIGYWYYWAILGLLRGGSIVRGHIRFLGKTRTGWFWDV